MSEALIVIPARYESTRLKHKLLCDIEGKSVIRRTWEQAIKCKRAARVIIAVDDQRLYDHVVAFGAEAVMTHQQHFSGTSRCIEVASQQNGFDIMVNVQGDEPLLVPELIDDLVERMNGAESPIATAAYQITDLKELLDSNTVKVVCDQHGNALYFSRSVIPYNRSHPKDEWLHSTPYLGHIGIYGFRQPILEGLGIISETPLAATEKLEQLSWLESGLGITVMQTPYKSIGVDSANDLERVRALVRASGTHP